MEQLLTSCDTSKQRAFLGVYTGNFQYLMNQSLHTRTIFALTHLPTPKRRFQPPYQQCCADRTSDANVKKVQSNMKYIRDAG